MSICDSEENRKKLAWLVPGYILLAWFFCVLFQPLGIHTPPSSHSKNSHRYHDVHDKNYEVIYLDADSSAKLCNNGILTLEEGSKSAMIIRLGRRQHVHLSYNDFSPFNCSLQVRAGKRYAYCIAHDALHIIYVFFKDYIDRILRYKMFDIFTVLMESLLLWKK